MTLADASRATEPKRTPLRTAFTWLVLLAIVAFIALAPKLIPRPDTDQHKHELAELELPLTARYILRAHQLLRATQQPQPAAQDQSFIALLQQHAKTPTDQLRLVPMIAEFQGPAAALERLDALEPKLTTPDEKRDARALHQIYSE